MIYKYCFLMNNMQEKEVTRVNQEQVHDILFNRKFEWQEIIYDLINTEQLDPWDVDISILTASYFEKISELEENDFFVSSKVLLAASLLLRIKSELLLNKYIKSVDEILFGKTEKKAYVPEKIELDEEIPTLVLKSPVPRLKKVTLKELINSLNKAINTENRRIHKEIINKNALRETGISMPKKKINIKHRIKRIYSSLVFHFNDTKNKKISYTEFLKKHGERKIETFTPLLHLENNQKVWLEQEKPFEEVHIWLKKTYIKHNGEPFSEFYEQEFKEDVVVERLKKGVIEEDFKKDFVSE